MNSPLQRYWLWACFACVLLASWAGGFSVVVTAVFIVIYLTGVALIGPPEPETDEVTEEDGEPYPDVDESEDAEPESGADAPAER